MHLVQGIGRTASHDFGKKGDDVGTQTHECFHRNIKGHIRVSEYATPHAEAIVHFSRGSAFGNFNNLIFIFFPRQSLIDVLKSLAAF